MLGLYAVSGVLCKVIEKKRINNARDVPRESGRCRSSALQGPFVCILVRDEIGEGGEIERLEQREGICSLVMLLLLLLRSLRCSKQVNCGVT